MNDRIPKVTVITPTHNRADTLKHAIESVVRQEFQDWEQIIINDGGVDVREIVASFDDPRLRYIHREKNCGKAVVLNVALGLARGEYVAYLDDDDMWYPNHLQVLAGALDENPDMGAAYSDLYAVQFVKDEGSGKRYPVNKWIQVSRDFNRDFMFHFNHTLHVSLMHRKELAIRAGSYDENVTVLIDWNITRKLCFYTDFKYVPVVTGEYYMSLTNSDRISTLERKDPEKYQQNLRKIKANLPPEPWPKVHRIGIVVPIQQWTDESVGRLKEMIDNIDYPVRYAIVNKDRSLTTKACKDRLGILAELKNVSVYTPKRALSDIASYRFGVTHLNVDYVYLRTEHADTKTKFRLINAAHYLGNVGNGAIRWEVPEEMKGKFDFLIAKSQFLRFTTPNTGDHNCQVLMLKPGPPRSFEGDFYYATALRHYNKGELAEAYAQLKKCDNFKEGAISEQYLVDLFAKVCFGLKNYEEAEEKCRAIIEQGYGADNWIRLGKILQYKTRYREAVSAYQKGLADLGLSFDDLNQDAFQKGVLPDSFSGFRATIGVGESLLEMGDLIEASKAFRRAARLARKSPRPTLGFCRMFLKTGDIDRARQGLTDLFRRRQFTAEACNVMGAIEEKVGNRDQAFQSYKKGLAMDPRDPEIQDNLYRLGSALERWEETRTALSEALEKCPESRKCDQYVQELDQRLGPRMENADSFGFDGWEGIASSIPMVDGLGSEFFGQNVGA